MLQRHTAVDQACKIPAPPGVWQPGSGELRVARPGASRLAPRTRDLAWVQAPRTGVQQLRACRGGAARKNRVQLGRGYSVLSPQSSALQGYRQETWLRVGGGQPEACGSMVCSAAPGGMVPVSRDVPRSGQGIALCRGEQGG